MATPGLLTSLLRRPQVQTLHDTTQPIGKIHPFIKIAITFEPAMRFECPSRFKITKKITAKAWRRCKDIFTNPDLLSK